MRSVALDLGRRIAFCEVAQQKVIRRATVTRFEELESLLGPRTPRATVAVEACREAWHIERRLREWGHEPLLVDTTRVKHLGVGQHKRKNDRIDAEVLALAVESGSIPLAHVLSPHRQALRMQLGVRRALVETRAAYVTMVRGVARAHGEWLPSCETEAFVRKTEGVALGEELRLMVGPLLKVIRQLDPNIIEVDRKLETLCSTEPVVLQLSTVPGVNLIVAAAFVSVVDDAKRFRHAHEVEAYIGLVPSEYTSVHRRLGSITKQGNSYLRALLIQAAWCAFRQRREDPIVLWAKSIARRRGNNSVAIVALARRLVGVLWAMWRDKTVYDPARLAHSSLSGLKQHVQSLEQQQLALQRAARKHRRRRRTLQVATGEAT
jgi:transposase